MATTPPKNPRVFPRSPITIRDFYTGVALLGYMIGFPAMTGNQELLSKTAHGMADVMLKTREETHFEDEVNNNERTSPNLGSPPRGGP